MGKRYIPEAQRFSIAALILYTFVVITLGTLIYTFRELWTDLFTSTFILFTFIYLFLRQL